MFCLEWAKCFISYRDWLQMEKNNSIFLLGMYHKQGNTNRRFGKTAFVMPKIYRGINQWHDERLGSNQMKTYNDFLILQFNLLFTVMKCKKYSRTSPLFPKLNMEIDEKGDVLFLKNSFLIQHADQELILTLDEIAGGRIWFLISKAPAEKELLELLQNSMIISEYMENMLSTGSIRIDTGSTNNFDVQFSSKPLVLSEDGIKNIESKMRIKCSKKECDKIQENEYILSSRFRTTQTQTVKLARSIHLFLKKVI